MTLEQLIRRLRDLVLEDPKAAQYEVLNGYVVCEIEEQDIQVEKDAKLVFIN